MGRVKVAEGAQQAFDQVADLDCSLFDARVDHEWARAKDAYVAAYGLAALDPHMLSMSVLVERFCFEIADSGDTLSRAAAERAHL